MKKKLFFNFFVFAVIGALVTMTSCKDYDDDISGLDNQVTAVKSDLTSLQSTVTAAQSAATAAQSSANDALAKANEALAAAQAAGDSESIAALEEEIEELVAEIADIKEELETLAGLEARIQGLIDELETAQNAKLDAIKEDILAITEQLGTLSFAKVNSMITEVSFDFVYDDYERYRFLDYSTTTEVVDYVFSTGINNAITFVEGQRLASQAQKIIVKVSPANADLSKMLDQISLIRGDNNTEINNYLKAVKAERANPLLVDRWGDFATTTTRATPTANGLWYVWFELSQTADLEELAELTYGEGKYLDSGVEEDSEGHYLFALVIENSVDEAEDADSRFIISDFVISINTSEEFYRASELEFLVDETDVAGINNRADDSSLSLNEGGITYEELVWDGDAQPVITGNTTVGDNRSQEPVYPAVQGVPMKIELTGEYTESIRAMYVTLDFKENAIESAPSEWNAWQSYSYSGLNTVVEGTETEIVINNASAINDIIGFRVFAVNYDGTLVDPDGKAFYVSLGVEGADWGTVNTVITPVGEAVDGTISANVAKTLTALTGAATYEWTTDVVVENEIEVTPAFHVVLKGADGDLFSTNGGDVTDVDFEDVTTIHTVPTASSWLAYEDDKVYNGTLVIKNGTGHVIATLKVTFKKELPTTAPSGFSIMTNQLGSDGIYRSYLVPTLGDDTPSWTAPNATHGSMPLDQVFNFTGDALTGVDNFEVIFANALRVDATTVGNLIVTPGDETLIVAKEFIDNKTEHETSVVYNYGEISTELEEGEDYVIEVENFPTIFNNIYNHTYTWRWATKADLGLTATEDLPYSTSIEYGATESFDLAHIFGESTRDHKYDAFLSAPYKASLQVQNVKLVSNSNELDEYFVVDPSFEVGNTTFILKEKSGSTNPTADVPSTLVITAKDMYDNDVEIRLPMTVTKR
jgi:polyhydroxyalkanoate synthesis regulator phasin